LTTAARIASGPARSPGRAGALGIGAVEVGQLAEDREQALVGAAIPVARREVGPREERLPLRGEDDGHRPAAAAPEEVDGVHVDGVDVGALLAVDLDGDEVLVDEARDLEVLEGLALHDVTPVAGRVAHAEQHRAVVAARALEGGVTPREPVHRVVGMLEEVGAGLGDEAVGEPRPALGGQVARARRVARSFGGQRRSQAGHDAVRHQRHPGQRGITEGGSGLSWVAGRGGRLVHGAWGRSRSGR